MSRLYVTSSIRSKIFYLFVCLTKTSIIIRLFFVDIWLSLNAKNAKAELGIPIIRKNDPIPTVCRSQCVRSTTSPLLPHLHRPYISTLPRSPISLRRHPLHISTVPISPPSLHLYRPYISTLLDCHSPYIATLVTLRLSPHIFPSHSPYFPHIPPISLVSINGWSNIWTLKTEAATVVDSAVRKAGWNYKYERLQAFPWYSSSFQIFHLLQQTYHWGAQSGKLWISFACCNAITGKAGQLYCPMAISIVQLTSWPAGVIKHCNWATIHHISGRLTLISYNWHWLTGVHYRLPARYLHYLLPCT